MTLVELMVASVVTLILLAMLTSTIGVFGKAEISTVNSANAAANVRSTLLQFQHDVQSANPLGTLSSVAAYNSELQLTLQPSGSIVTWQYVFAPSSLCPTGTCLTRQLGSGSPVVELTALTNGDPSSDEFLPLFDYYDHCAINQVTEPQATPASVSGDTTVVQITLAVANLNSAPYGTTTRVQIMNQPPGPNRCG